MLYERFMHLVLDLDLVWYGLALTTAETNLVHYCAAVNAGALTPHRNANRRVKNAMCDIAVFLSNKKVINCLLDEAITVCLLDDKY